MNPADVTGEPMNPAAILLADPSPCLRTLVLRELLDRPADDPEVRELEPLLVQDALVRELVERQRPDGSWRPHQYDAPSGPIRVTAHALSRLGRLGFGEEFPAVRRGADFLFSRQLEDGSWPLVERSTADADGTVEGGAGKKDASKGADVADGTTEDEGGEGYSMIPLQTALPLFGLVSCGFRDDPRVGRAFDWLLARRLPDGAWPTGKAAGNPGYVAGYRRIPHSRWGCRSNTTGALACLTMHPEHRRETAALRALDLLLGRETRDAHSLGFEAARLAGAEPLRGFVTRYARFDPAQVLSFCALTGASPDDPRVASLVEFILSLRGPHGLWEYPDRPQAARWVSFDLLRSLSRLDRAGGWIGTEPSSPFSPTQEPFAPMDIQKLP